MNIINKAKSFINKQKIPATPITREVAPTSSLERLNALYFDKVLENKDPVLRYESNGKGYDLYYDMLGRDTHINSVVHTRFHGVAGLEWDVMPYDPEDATAVKIAEFCSLKLKQLERLHHVLAQMAHGVFFGYSVGEIMWDVDFDGSWIVRQIRSRHQKRFNFNAEGDLCMKDTAGSFKSKPVPPYKFALLQHNTQGENPYGTPLAMAIFWMWKFKLVALKYGLVGLEKFGLPSIDGAYKGTPEDKKLDEVEAQIAALRSTSSVLHSDNIELKLLEATQKAGMAHWDAARFFNQEISTMVLGQPLTSMEGQKSGARSLGEVHERIQSDILASDSLLVMHTFNKDVIKPMVAFNFGEQPDYPIFTLKYETGADLDALANRYKVLYDMRVPITIRQVLEQFTIYEREGDEPILEAPQFGLLPGQGEEEEPEESKSKPKQAKPAKSAKKEENQTEGDDGRVNLAEKPGAWKKPPEGVKQIVAGASLKVRERFRRKLQAIYGDLLEELAHNFVNNPDGIKDMLDDIIEKEFRHELAGPMTDAVEDTIRASAIEMAGQLKMTFNHKVFKSLTKSYVKQWGYDKGVMDGMRDTLRKILGEQIDNVLASGGSLDDMVTALRSQFSEMSLARAQTIAISETQRAANHAVLQMAKRSSRKLEAWFVGDRDTCDICVGLSARNPWSIDKAQAEDYPHPNCDCQWIITEAKK